MISEEARDIIKSCAKKYDVKKIYLFGSSLNPNSEPNDIDLAIEGVSPDLFFKLYGELIVSLSEKVDIVDLSEINSFNQIIRKKGLPIYESA